MQQRIGQGSGLRFFRYFRGLGGRLGLTLFVAGLALSPNVWDAIKVLRLAGEGAIAAYRLRSIPPERFAVEIETAFARHDNDLARSLLALAGDHDVKVPPELAARVLAVPPFDIVDVAGQGWNCFVNGDFETEAGFACVVAVDLTSVGDVRDLLVQGGNYVTGQPVDHFALGVSAVGLTLSAATVGTGGGMLPVRAGASFVKAVKKAGKLPPRLTAEIATALAKGINGAAVDEALVLARSFRLDELHRPLGRLFDPKSAALVSDLAADFGRIHRAGGVRAMKLSVEAADTTRDVRMLAKTADRFADRFPAVMKLLGKGAIRLADILWTLGSWVVAAVLWGLTMAWFILRGTTKVARFLDRTLFPRKTVAA
jgi:hypothetical protein